MSWSPLPTHLATRTWCPLHIFEERMSKMFVSIKHINESIILYTFHHTQVYWLYVVVQVALHVWVFHPYWWNNHPLPNIPFVHPFRNLQFLHTKRVQARRPLWQNILPSILEELVPWKKEILAEVINHFGEVRVLPSLLVLLPNLSLVMSVGYFCLRYF